MNSRFSRSENLEFGLESASENDESVVKPESRLVPPSLCS